MNVREQWQIATDAAHRYEGVVARYILGPWAPAIVEAGRVTGGVRVLDLACGTGVVARLAAQRAGIQGRVIGVDLNPAMLNVARSLCRRIARVRSLQRCYTVQHCSTRSEQDGRPD